MTAQQNTARDDAMTAMCFPIRLLTVACLLTFMVFAWFGWIIFDAHRDAKMFIDRLSRIEELRGVIVHLDEVLTMSARMAAATGDSRWEVRYHHFEPQLDAAIKETVKMGVSSSHIKAAAKTDAANLKLVEMENHAFALVRAGRNEEAQTFLFSPEYETQKQIYAEGMASLTDQIRHEFDENLRDNKRIDLLSIIAAMVVGGTSFMAWLSAARGVRRWRAQLLDSSHRRAEAEDDLHKAHAGLEVRVTERTAELASANETLRLLNSAVLQAKEAILITDAELGLPGPRIIFVNPAFTQMTGYTAEEAIGKTPRILQGPRTDKTVLSRLRQNLERGEVFEGEAINYRKDGKEFNLEWQIAPIRNASGKITHFVAIQRDITERKRAEEELTLSRLCLAEAQHIAQVGSWEWDVETDALTWSDEKYRLFGFAPNACAVNREFQLNCVHPEDRPAARTWIETVLATGKPMQADFRIVRPDAEVRVMHTRANGVFDENGKVIRILGTSQDITERVKAERALTISEERTRLIVATAHDAFIGMDSAGLITDWNPRAEATFGWSREEVVGQPMHELIIPPKFREMHVRDLKHFLATGDGPVMNKLIEVSAIHRDGREMPIELMISPICIGDGFIFSASIRDITERKRAEMELKQAKEAAEAASRAKSEFLANMSHEIRTPMNGIIGMTELVLETELGREQREYLGMANSSAHALLGLINDILDFSKIEAGKLELEAISFSLRDCLGMMLKPLGMRADQKGIELTADIPAEVPDHLFGDPMRLRQILINLTDNAIKFTDHGDVMLRVAVESATDAEHCLHFSIADTGIGIPAAKQALIFEAFAQADGTTTRTYGGTGLGLAIASQLVRKMGGRIWVESTVGKGTTFHFTAHLPVRHTPAPNVWHADPRRLDGLRVLVVDDNPVNLRILREMLAHWRMQPSVVASGAEAIVEMLRAARAGTPFPLVILDAMMPETDGFMVAEKIREHAELSGATVMMLSSAMPSGAVARCGNLGVASYLMKPVSQSQLLDAALSALGGAAELESAAEAAPIVRAANGLRILLAEDNVINRALAAGILEKHGDSLVHAANGRETVEAAAREAFDLIFMDVQMPEMDGFEATRRIRESERATGRHTPIVAMTAHAMAGDRERCLASGMDDYISKPLQKAELLALLERVGVKTSTSCHPERSEGSASDRNAVEGPLTLSVSDRGSGKDRGPSIVPAAPRTSRKASNPLRPAQDDSEDNAPAALPIFSRKKLLDQLDGDEALMQRMIALFHENTPRLLDDIRGSIARRGARDLARAAHALLSSLGAFGANDAHHLTLQLEAQAHAENYEHTDRTFAALERGTADIHAALAAFAPARA